MTFADFQRRFFDLASHRRPVDNLALFEAVASTNDVGRRYLEDVLSEGEVLQPALLLAYEQTSGRGRRGRTWTSSAGLGVYCTLIWPVTVQSRLQTLPMLVGVALAEVLDRHTGSEVRLKWPNDLVIAGKKLGGVLIETVSVRDSSGAVIGFGINHGHEPSQLPLATATSLRLEAPELPTLEELVFELAGALVRELCSSIEASEIVRRYREWSAHAKGDVIGFRLGNEALTGSVAGIDDRGCLCIETEAGLRVVGAGEVIEAVASPVADRG